jgi:DNA anti-recombination protein RmuC
MATATDDRLSAMRRRINRLEERAKTRMGLYVSDLKDEERSARETAHAHAGAVEEKIEQLNNDLDIAEHRLSAEMTDDRTRFTSSVEATLRGWDVYLERLQANAAERTGAARERVEHAISEIRRGRTAAAESLAGVSTATGDKWRETKTRVLAQLDELKRKADDAGRE